MRRALQMNILWDYLFAQFSDYEQEHISGQMTMTLCVRRRSRSPWIDRTNIGISSSIFFFSLFLRKIANTKQWHVYFWCYETVFVDSMAISLIFTIEKSFLSYLIKNILLAFWLNRGGKWTLPVLSLRFLPFSSQEMCTRV